MREMRCSFCGKRDDQVQKLVAGGARPGTFICDECVEVCRRIIAEESSPEPTSPPGSGSWMERIRRIAVTLPR